MVTGTEAGSGHAAVSTRRLRRFRHKLRHGLHSSPFLGGDVDRRGGQRRVVEDVLRPPCHATGRVPRQDGYAVQPQNSFPALAPRFAVRRTMGFEQVGQLGSMLG